MTGIIIEKKDFDKPMSCPACGKQFKDVYDWNLHECDQPARTGSGKGR